MSVPGVRWSSFDRVVVTHATAPLTSADFDAIASAVTAIATRVRKRVLLVQVSTLSGGLSVHRVGSDPSTTFGRYTAALRTHVEEVHAVAAGGGLVGGFMRGLVSAVTRLGSQPSILHADTAALLEDLRRRHGIEVNALRDTMARLATEASR